MNKGRWAVFFSSRRKCPFARRRARLRFRYRIPSRKGDNVAKPQASPFLIERAFSHCDLTVDRLFTGPFDIDVHAGGANLDVGAFVFLGGLRRSALATQGRSEQNQRQYRRSNHEGTPFFNSKRSVRSCKRRTNYPFTKGKAVTVASRFSPTFKTVPGC